MVTAETERVLRRRPPAARMLAAQIGYQLRLLVRTPLAAFATLVIPVMVMLAVTLLFQTTRLPTRGNIRYAQFFTAAMVAFAVVSACYMSVISSITLARDQGILKRIRSTPLPPWIYMAGRVVSAAFVGLVGAAAVVTVGAALYDFQIVWAAVPAALLTVAVAMFSFCALGLAVSVLVPSAEAAIPVAWGTILPLCFISDVFQPIDSAPAWLKQTAAVFPLRPFADDLERLFNPVTGSVGVDWTHLAVLAAWGVVAAVFALMAFRWEPAREARRAGASRRTAGFAADQLKQVFQRHG
jgi:ABC-2 type transport system permease protein